MPPQESTQASDFVQPQSPPIVTTLQVGKFKASRMIVGQSWAVLKQDKEIMWFPVLSAITSIVALTILTGVIFLTGDGYTMYFDGASGGSASAASYEMLLVYYLVMFFIVNFFQAGIYAIVHGRFNGQNLSFSDGIHVAIENAGKIFIWSLISATVGVILRAIADRSKMLGKIIAWFLSAAWGILTYFSLPALIIGNVSVSQSFKDSASLIRKTWGEVIIINIGVGLFFTMLSFLEVALAIGIVILVPSFDVAIGVLILSVIYFIILSIVSSALGAIFKLALYEYATTGKVPQGFSPELIQNAIRVKK